jgi:hypothetical protein
MALGTLSGLQRRASAPLLPVLGSERYTVEIIDTEKVEALARKQGWPGGIEGLREFCEPEDAAEYRVCRTLDEAIKMARAWLAKGSSFYGCCIIDHEIYEPLHDDLGNRVKGASWEVQRSYEVANDDEVIEVDR